MMVFNLGKGLIDTFVSLSKELGDLVGRDRLDKHELCQVSPHFETQQIGFYRVNL